MSRGLQRAEFVELDTRRCQACWRCVEVCPGQVIGKVSLLWHKHARLRDDRACTGCFACVAVCPGQALEKLALQRREACP